MGGGGGGGGRKTNVNLTSGRWPRWVARYEKGGWAVHFRSDIRGGGGQFASGPEASQAGTRTT